MFTAGFVGPESPYPLACQESPKRMAVLRAGRSSGNRRKEYAKRPYPLTGEETFSRAIARSTS